MSSDNDLQSKADQAADKPEIDSGSKADAQLEALRQLILGSEMERLSLLEQRVDDPEQQARFISDVLPAAVAPPKREGETTLEKGPLGSLTATLGNGVVVGILPEEGSEVFGISTGS